MTSKLPDAIASYYAAEKASDGDALARCFAPDGLVRDEGRTQTGRAAIAEWMADAKRRYRHSTEVVGVTGGGDDYDVTVRVSGAFPNSPLTLTQRFRLADGVIKTLEIG